MSEIVNPSLADDAAVGIDQPDPGGSSASSSGEILNPPLEDELGSTGVGSPSPTDDLVNPPLDAASSAQEPAIVNPVLETSSPNAGPDAMNPALE